MSSYCEKFAGKYGFSARPMNPPPAETASNVIQFELTTGCSHDRCTFCTMYEKKSYSEKSLDEFGSHVGQVLNRLSLRERSRLERIFIGGGNALGVDTEKLTMATQYALSAVYVLSRHLPRRVAVYGNTNDILHKGRLGLKEVNCGGTCSTRCSVHRFGDRRGIEVVYWGLESGDDAALRVGGKGYDHNRAMHAADILRGSQVRSSIMVIPGLGGIAHSEGHVRNTAQVLNHARPEWVTFMGLVQEEGTPYARWMAREQESGSNRPLTQAEIVEQTAQIIERITVSTNIGVHGTDVHERQYNPVPIGVDSISYDRTGSDVARRLRDQAAGLGNVVPEAKVMKKAMGGSEFLASIILRLFSDDK